MNRATHRGVYVLNDLISQKDFYSLQETSHLLNLSMNELLSEISNRSLDLYINTKFLGVSRWDSLRENTVGLEIFFNKKLDNVKTFFFKGRISEVFFFEENNNIKQDEFFLSADKVVYGGYFVINKSRSFLIEKDMFFTKEMTLEQIRTPTINSELKEDVIANVCLKLKYINPFEYDECFISSYSIRCFFFKKLQRKGFCARYIYLQKFFKNALKAFNTSDLDTDNTVATSNLIGELRSDQQKTIQQLQDRIIELEDLVNTNVEQYRDVNSETVLELQNQISEKDKIIGELREQLQQKHNNTASDNKKNAFIKALLHIHYGEQVAENPRPHVYDPNSSEKSKDGLIQKDFELNGLEKHLPSGRTLQNWTKSIEL